MSGTSGVELRLNDAAESHIDDLQRRYPDKRSTILHVLWQIQWQEGWISPEWMRYVAARCEVPGSHVMSVVTFYTMFHLKPAGRHHLQVCRNISCHMMGAPAILARVKERTGLENGEVSADGKWSLQEVECMAACCGGPMMAVNETYHEHLEKVDEILAGLDQVS